MATPYRVTPEMWRVWTGTKPTIPGVRLGGIYANKRYYHSSVNENLAKWAPNYSIRVSLDLNGGNKDKARAIDLTMSDAEMRKRTKYLRESALDADDDRLYAMREFYGTLDGRTVYGLIKDDEDGPWRFSSSDSSHLWHIHAAFLAAFVASWKALAGFVSVISGESLASWRKRTGGASLPSSGVPSGTYREGDTGTGVRRLQAALNEAIDAELTVDGIYGPATTAAVMLLQRLAGITIDGIYGNDSENALRDLLEDDMPTADEYAEAVWAEKKTSPVSGKEAGMHVFVRYTHRAATETLAATRRIESGQRAVLAAVEGLDTEAVIAAINARAAEDAERDTALLSEVQGLASGGATAQEIVDQIAARLSESGA